MRRPAVAGLVLTIAALAGACGNDEGEVVHETAVDRGRALFASARASGSGSNAFSCATCHPGEAPTPERIFPGGSLGGATTRTRFWGGNENDLLRSINACRTYFMDAPRPWTEDEDDARSMYAYLSALAGSAEPVAFTEVSPTVVAGGDAARGERTFAAACKVCHGDKQTGEGRAASFVTLLPDAFVAQHPGLDVRALAAAKIRRGGMATPGESMPPFSREVLRDEDVADVIAYLGL